MVSSQRFSRRKVTAALAVGLIASPIMKRKVCYSLLLLLVICPIAIDWWYASGPPPTVSYEQWSAPPHYDFPLSESKDDPGEKVIRPEQILHSQDFLFSMGVGSGLSGLDVLRVNQTGTASYTFRTSEEDCWTVTFQVSEPVVTKLRQTLVQMKYLELKRSYHAAVIDGTQWCIRLEVDGISKAVYCDNYFPAVVGQLAEFVRDEILHPNEKKIMRAWKIRPKAARDSAKDLW
jgi:hypothetical protein